MNERQFMALRKAKEGKLSAGLLRMMLSYDELTGDFTWLENRGGVNCRGKRAGTKSANGYWRIHVNGYLYFAHRLAWLWVHGRWPENFIDHTDGDTCNNRISNLRDVTQTVNCQNLKCANVDSKTQILGCFPAKNGFQAQIRIAGKLKHLGTFATLAEAENLYLETKRRLHEGCTI